MDALLGSPDRIPALQKDGVLPDNEYSTLVHELIHWQDANAYRRIYGEITGQNYVEYMAWLNARAKRELDKLEAKGYNVHEISKYAKDSYNIEKFDETYTEYRTFLKLGGDLDAKNNSRT